MRCQILAAGAVVCTLQNFAVHSRRISGSTTQKAPGKKRALESTIRDSLYLSPLKFYSEELWSIQTKLTHIKENLIFCLSNSNLAAQLLLSSFTLSLRFFIGFFFQVVCDSSCCTACLAASSTDLIDSASMVTIATLCLKLYLVF